MQTCHSTRRKEATMPVKMTLREAQQAYVALQQMPPIRGRAGFDLGRWGDKLHAEVKQLEVRRQEIRKRHGTENEKDGSIMFTPEQEKAATVEFDELLDGEIEIERHPVKLEAVLGKDPEHAPEIAPAVFERLVDKVIVEE